MRHQSKRQREQVGITLNDNYDKKYSSTRRLTTVGIDIEACDESIKNNLITDNDAIVSAHAGLMM